MTRVKVIRLSYMDIRARLIAIPNRMCLNGVGSLEHDIRGERAIRLYSSELDQVQSTEQKERYGETVSASRNCGLLRCLSI